MKRIKLTKGRYALVDDSDYDELSNYKWCVIKNLNTFYATSHAYIDDKRTTIRMHRIIMNPPEGMIIDHKNGDGLDNQKSNLRICTYSENSRNINSHKNSTSKYIGVSYSSSYGTWLSMIMVDGKNKSLGYFKTELEAAIIRNIAARKYYKEFAKLNKF